MAETELRRSTLPSGPRYCLDKLVGASIVVVRVAGKARRRQSRRLNHRHLVGYVIWTVNFHLTSASTRSHTHAYESQIPLEKDESGTLRGLWTDTLNARRRDEHRRSMLIRPLRIHLAPITFGGIVLERFTISLCTPVREHNFRHTSMRLPL